MTLRETLINTIITTSKKEFTKKELLDLAMMSNNKLAQRISSIAIANKYPLKRN